MKKLVILGGSGIGMIAASVARESGEYEVCGFLNDVVSAGTKIGKYEKIQVIGTTDDIQYYLDNGYYFFYCIRWIKKRKRNF